jgi:hypothetical protein
MKDHEYLGRVVTTRAHQHGAAWRGSYQIDGGPVVEALAMPPSHDQDGAHADALGQAMRAINEARR